MRDAGRSGDSNLAAGYTYLGQFIDHDLTLDLTPLGQVTPARVRHTPNFRTPALDLDHVYGGGPNMSPFLYQKYESDLLRGKERFLLGETAKSTVKDAVGHPHTLCPTLNDLPRNSEGIALVGDSRQDENLIIAQLHVAFLKLHNFVLDHPDECSKSEHYDIEPAFEAARRVVTWHYQWIVRHDFLKSILDENVLMELESGEHCSLIATVPDYFQIPVEFSVAAFRFGHSMVRQTYFYNDWHGNAHLREHLFQRTGLGPAGSVPVPEDWRIRWGNFFRLAAQPTLARTRRIDTYISDDLFALSPPQRQVFSAAETSGPSRATDPPDLPVRTLLRGARMGLPNGQTVAQWVLQLNPTTRVLEPDEIAKSPNSNGDADTIKHYGFDRDTPLWYYILKEAEIIGSGDRLGPIGSRIVGDVILAALNADRGSYINIAGPNWKPTLWEVQEVKPPNNMAKLLTLIS